MALQTPWHALKETELQALRQRRRGCLLSRTISRLRKLVAQCGADTDAVEAICYHGSLALIFEFEQDWSTAAKHRELEIQKIRRLHKLEDRNPTSGYATQNYQAEDLSERLEILQQIKSKITEQTGCSEPRDSVSVSFRIPVARGH